MENETFENITVENTTNTNTTTEEEQNLIDTPVATAYDYYDTYYDKVLTSLNNIETQQNTIIENEQLIIACHQQHNTSFGLISFILGVIVCYMFVKDILH